MSNDPLMNISNLAYVEELYASYLRDPGSVGPEWQATFRAMPDDPFTSNPALEPAAGPSSIFNPPGTNRPSSQRTRPQKVRLQQRQGPLRCSSARPAESDVLAASLQERPIRLVRSYRVRGHLIAKLDPLGSSSTTTRTLPRILRSSMKTRSTFPGDCVHAMEL